MRTHLTTPIDILPQPTVRPHSRLLLLGSCFTDAVGARMEQGGLSVLRNPFGVLYNPLSIADCLDYCLEQRTLDDTMLVQHDGLWHSWLHHTTLSHPDREACRRQCHERIDAAHQCLQVCDTIVVTWGTAYAYYLTTQPDNGQSLSEPLLVANCHKVPARHFDRRRLSVEEIVQAWLPLCQKLAQLPQQPRIIFTVSPIRHLADGAHGNQLSKATLLLALDHLSDQWSVISDQQNRVSQPATDPQFSILNSQFSISYFPAYEIMMDELRDYRFYDRDMLHPSDLAVDIIWQRFQQTYLLPETIEHCLQGEKKYRQSQHRTINNTTN